ncbi:MAG: molybdopterin-dependent oxidoreductase [Deltaproteobacteria bacterium]|nr:molybdopterin-dependent oxidoreductase [Deltaproteobacteria bacterium]
MSDGAWKKTACILCECNCGLEVMLGGEGGRHLVKVRGDRAHPASQGYACEKPHRLDHYQSDPGRLTSPLRRRPDGSFEAIGWDVAIREVAERLARVRDVHGGGAIFYYGGGGQGNHLPGAYATATRRALGSRHRSSALAQEKTGEFWVAARMMGSATRADFEHCDVALFLGKNPWHSHSIPRARVTLRAIAADPARTLIVVDPRRTETAELADIHLAVRPGTDAWLLVALVGILLAEGRIDRAFLERHVAPGELAAVQAALGRFSIPDAIARTGVEPALVERAARAIGGARALASFEDLGVQMNHHSTLVSYLHRVLVLLTGSLGKPGSHYLPATLVDIASGEEKAPSPVAGARVVGGLVPCNVVADEILTDHPARYRAMLVEGANPAHSLAGSPRMRQALAALDTLVVIDVALSETARLAHYVLPAASQFEKAEATFFNLEFPRNHFHLRRRLLPPLAGTLPEAEIHARLCEALGAFSEADLAPLREAAGQGLTACAMAFLQHVLPDPRLSGLAPVLLYRTLAIPDEVREGAVLLGIAARAAMKHGPSLARAGFGGSPVEAACALFERMLAAESGLVFAVDEWDEVLRRAPRQLHLALPDMLAELSRLGEAPPRDPAFPLVLSAGERRSFTANTIIRDPAWRKTDAAGALRVSLADALALGVGNGARVRLVTPHGAATVPVELSAAMQPGHVSLPNGLGVGDGAGPPVGVAPNELTGDGDRDPFVGTPWHKHVPARIERA